MNASRRLFLLYFTGTLLATHPIPTRSQAVSQDPADGKRLRPATGHHRIPGSQAEIEAILTHTANTTRITGRVTVTFN